MTTSRRPNQRASSEYAPGPRRRMAAAIITRKIVAGTPPNRSGINGGSQENARLTLMSSARKLASGVRQPIRSAAPVTRTSRPTAHAPLRRSLPMRQAPPWTISARPTVARNSSRPTPGPPLGNDENNLCSSHLLGRSRIAPEASYRMTAHGESPDRGIPTAPHRERAL
jgi:hypothetical protein